MEYFLPIIAFAITLIAQGYVTSTYNRYKKTSISQNITGEQIARQILDNNGLYDVVVNEVSGTLSDNYNPNTKTVNLSSSNFHGTTISAAAVSAHECGHAIQDKEGYTFLRIRAYLVPIVNFASNLGYIAICLGFILSILNLVWIGIIAELLIIAFQFVTLPVEFNASSRALKEIEKYNLLDSTEIKKGKKVLKSAALTYVAGAATALLELLRLVLILNSRRDD